MKIFAFLLPLAAAIALPASLWAQSTPVILQGTVRDSVQTIPYASVYLKKHPEKGTRTDQNGRFVLLANEDILPDTLIVSCVGYHTFSKPVPKGLKTLEVLDVQMYRSTVILDSIVVMGVSEKELRRAKATARYHAEILERRRAMRELNFKFEAREIFLPQRGWTSLSPGLNFLLFNDGFMVYCESLFRTYFQPSLSNGFSGHDGPFFMASGRAEILFIVEGEDEIKIYGQSNSPRLYEEFIIQADPASYFCSLEFPNIHEPPSLKKEFDANESLMNFNSLKYRGVIIPYVEKIDPKLLMEDAIKEVKEKEKARADRRAKRGK